MGVTVDIPRRRKCRHVAWCRFDVNGQGGCLPSQTLRTDTGPVDLFQEALLHAPIEGVKVGSLQGSSEQGPLGEPRDCIEVPSQSDPNHRGGTGVGTGLNNGLDDPSLDLFGGAGRREHLQTAHVLRPPPLAMKEMVKNPRRNSQWTKAGELSPVFFLLRGSMTMDVRKEDSL